MLLINLQPYIPDTFFNGEGIQYFKDATGKDWFQSFDQFTKKNVIAFECDTGIVRGITDDASRLYPVGLSVTDLNIIPDNCDNSGAWFFDGEKVIPRIYNQAELEERAQDEKRSLIVKAKEFLEPLQDSDDLEIATNEEKASLIAWKKYRVLLSRIDTSLAPNIEWPEIPSF